VPLTSRKRAAAAMRMLLFHFGVRRQSRFIGRDRFGLHSLSSFAHAIRKRRRRFAVPAHSKSLHAFHSLGRQANIDFGFATSGFGITARDTLLEPDRRNLSQPNQTPISRAISARVTGMLFVFPWKRGESYRYLSLSTRLKPERWKYACGLKIRFSRY